MDDAVGGSVGFLPAEGENRNLANNGEEKIDLKWPHMLISGYTNGNEYL